MSCDHLAAHAIATLGASLPAETREQLQAVYDQPGTLKRGEDIAAFTRAGKALILRLRASGAEVPEHLNLSRPGTRSALKFGRLAVALTEAEQAEQRRRDEAELAARRAAREQAGDADPDEAERNVISDRIIDELLAEEKELEAAQKNRPTTPQMKRAMRAVLNADPLLEEETSNHRFSPAKVPNIVARGTAVVAQLEALPPEQIPTGVYQALQSWGETQQLLDYVRQESGPERAAEWEADGLFKVIQAVKEEAGPPPPDPNFPAGAWVQIGAASGLSAEVPVGSVGWVDEWDHRGMAMVAFELPFRTTNGDEWERGDEDDTPDRRRVRYGFRPREMTRASGAQALVAAQAIQHPGDRAVAIARLVPTPMTPEEREAAMGAALDAVDWLPRDAGEARDALRQLVNGLGTSPHLAAEEREAMIRAAEDRYVARLRNEDSLGFDTHATAIARLSRAGQDALLPAIRRCKPYWQATVLATLVREGGRADLDGEVRALAATLDKPADQRRILAALAPEGDVLLTR